MKRLLLTMGTFAVPHVGHAAFLRQCEHYGEVLVGVNSDAFVGTYKGIAPLFDQTERMGLIRSLGYKVRLNDGPGRELIYEVGPDILAVGTDWARRDYLKQLDITQDELDELLISVVYVPMRPLGISSTEVIRRCRAA